MSRIKDDSGKLIEPSDQPVCYASAMLRLRRENGGDGWVKRFFHELAAAPASNPNTKKGALNQSWHWLLCASVAAQKDLSPVFAGEWKLPIAEEHGPGQDRLEEEKPIAERGDGDSDSSMERLRHGPIDRPDKGRLTN